MLNTTNDISPRTNGYAVRKLLDRGNILQIFGRIGQIDPQGMNNTTVRRYRRYNNVAPAIAPLAEGVTPPGKKLTFDDIIVNLEQFGDFIPISDVIADTHEDAVLNESVRIIGEQCAETIEIIRFNILKAGSNVYYTNGTSRLTLNSTIDRGTLRKVNRGFHRFKAKMITEQIDASVKISTSPCEAGWVAVTHTDMEADIRGINGFVPTVEYSNQKNILPGEVGKVENFRFVCNRLCEAWINAATSVSVTTWLANGIAPAAVANPDVYPILCFGMDAFSIVPLQMYKADTTGKYAPINLVVRNPQAAPGDELGQRGFVSWKMYQGTGILNQNWMARIETNATANPA